MNAGTSIEGVWGGGTAFPWEGLVRIRRDRERPRAIEVELARRDAFADLRELECHLVLYPYSHDVTSDDYVFLPFEEYVSDIATGRRSAYRVESGADAHLFGLALGVILAIVATVFSPRASLLTIEALLSLLGAYFVGKDLWGDVEGVLTRLTARTRLRFVERTFRYELERDTTLTRYSEMARRQRYGVPVALPERLDFMAKSNSQTVRMGLSRRRLLATEGEWAHVLTVEIEEASLAAFEAAGYLFGVKISLNRRLAAVGTRSLELFQSIHGGEVGCVDAGGAWRAGAVFFRETARVGRVKWFRTQGVFEGKRLLAPELEGRAPGSGGSGPVAAAEGATEAVSAPASE